MDSRRTVSPESALASDIFDKFCTANTLKGILTQYRHLCKTVRLKPTHFPDFYPRLKVKLSSWRAQGLWSKFEKRASNKCYGRGKVCYGSRVLIIGAGPCGLRAAIEAQLLGAKVVLIEKRDRFSRNNVLHLWPFVIADLKALGAKKFYGKFCAGSIDHISIRQLQCILLKVALLLGVEVLEGVSFEGLCEPTENEGWRANVSPANHPVSHYNFDALIGADGRRNTLDGFKRTALRAKLAIAITANFINKRTEAEARVKEISGVSYIFNQKFFQELNEATGIDLENIVYYKDETHYFVMTAKKQSLLNKGVLLKDHADTAKLLSHENISSEALMTYALEAAFFSTDNQLPNLDFAVNHYGQPDVAMFDFTAMYAAENACRVVQRKGHKLLMSLVGDSLLEPFWPTGSGCARGFLSSFDACWMLRSWATGKSILEVIAERESIYRLLGQTTPENLNKEHLGYSIDPYSRYPNLNLRVVMPFQVKSLYESDEPIELADGQQQEELLFDEKASKKRRRDSVIPVDHLMSWLREQVVGYEITITDACDAFLRGDVLCAIINRFRPDLIEFPFPIESEENLDPIEIAACRNQIAFDLLHEEHGLVPVMSGFESVQCTSSDFLTLVAYLSQIYEVFKGEIPQMKYSRVESSEELEDNDQRSSHSIPKQHYNRPALVVKHTTVGKPVNRRSRVSSSTREGKTDDSESSRRHKKRRSDERSRGREIKTSSNLHSEADKQHVTGLAKNLEEKLKGSKHTEKKPKDLIRAIGKIEKSDWNVQLIEKKIAESKTHCHIDKVADKVPKWSREAFDDKREAMKRKMEGTGTDNKNNKLQLFEDTVKKLGSKLKEGNTLEIGQRGSNKVSQMAEKLVHKLERPKDDPSAVIKPSVQRPAFEFPKKGGSELCHFCNERVYVVERVTAEGKFFHSSCFRCEYCNRSFSKFSSNYVFDRDSRYGDRFYCTPHFRMIRMYGWKKYDQDAIASSPDGKFSGEGSHLLVSPTQHQKILEDRGMTPERVEFENSVDFTSEVNSDIDEDEWTEKNCFGSTSNADNNTSDEASDLSDDDTPEGNDGGSNHGFAVDPDVAAAVKRLESSDSDTEKISGEASGSEIESEDEEASDDEELDDDDDDDGDDDDDDEEEDEEEEEEEEEECGGSTTEIETDSEFAEDPPQSVPGTIPTIVVDEPEQLVTKIMNTSPLSHTRSPVKIVSNKHARKGHHHHRQNQTQNQSSSHHHQKSQVIPVEEEEPLNALQYRMVEPVPVKRSVPERVLPRVNPVPKKWEPLATQNQDHNLASKLSLELKKKYLHGAITPLGGMGVKKPADQQNTGAQNQFRSVLDMISEQQKLLQPAAKPSATMQAFLESSDKLKLKQQSPLGSNSMFSSVIGGVGLFNHESVSPANPIESVGPKQFVGHHAQEAEDINKEKSTVNLQDMNRLNLEKNVKSKADLNDDEEKKKEERTDDEEKGDYEKEIGSCRFPSQEHNSSLDTKKDSMSIPTHSNRLHQSETPSVSQSETDTQSTIVDTNNILKNDHVFLPNEGNQRVVPLSQDEDENEEEEDDENCSNESNQDSDTDNPLSEDDDDDADDIDDDEDGEYEIKIIREPPRVEIEDEFGVTLNLDDENKISQHQRTLIGSGGGGGESDNVTPTTTSTTPTTFKSYRNTQAASNTENDDSDTDDLNSGMFLETEMSDWARDADAGESGGGEEDQHFVTGKNRKLKRLKNKSAVNSSNNSGINNNNNNNNNNLPLASAADSDNFDKYTKLKASLTLDIAGLDFMDVDGISSPEDILIIAPKKQGYCKLANEEIDSDNDAIHPMTTSKVPTNIHPVEASDNEIVIGEKESSSCSSVRDSRESTPTVGSLNEAMNKVVIEQHLENIPLIKPQEIIEAVNPIFGNQAVSDLSSTSAILLPIDDDTNKENNKSAKVFAMLDRTFIPFAQARDSLDYRKMKNTSSPSKSKDLFSAINTGVPTAARAQDINTNTNKKLITSPEKVFTIRSDPVEFNQDEDELLICATTNIKPTTSSPVKSQFKITTPPTTSSTLQINEASIVNSQYDENNSTSSNSSGSIKSSTSPNTARRIAEINTERAKQSDLIRTMVMGRIRKSPEKTQARRGSRGSSPPLGGSSSSASGGSFEQQQQQQQQRNPHEVESGDNDNESHRSSQHSVLTTSTVNTEITDESQRIPSSLCFIEGSSIVTTSSDDGFSHTTNTSNSTPTSSSACSNEDPSLTKNIDKEKNNEQRLQQGKQQQQQQELESGQSPSKLSHIHYTPVFTSSPRFRNRPKFDSPFGVYAYTSTTNPSTPTTPGAPAQLFTPTTCGHTDENELNSQEGPASSSVQVQRSRNERGHYRKNSKSKSPSFYRSMPDLSSFLVTPLSTQQNPRPSAENWTVFDCRVKARQAARERARLKSDQELGLDQSTDYILYKDKLRRKISVPEDDVFDPDAAIIVSTTTTKVNNTDGGSNFGSPLDGNNLRSSNIKRGRPLSDVFDNVSSSIRHNVDFPLAKTNPFLVYPGNEEYSTQNKRDNFIINQNKPAITPSSEEQQQQQIQQSTSQHRHHHHDSPRKSIDTDDFVHLQLRINSKNAAVANERRTSPEKVKSAGWEPDNFPNYFTPAATNSNWPQQQQQQRPRSNTLSDSYIVGATNADSIPGNTISSDVFAPSAPTNTTISLARLPTSSPTTTSALLSPANANSNSSASSNKIMIDSSTPSSSSSPLSKATSLSKPKALSSDMLLDSDSPSENIMHLSVPDKLDVSTDRKSPSSASPSFKGKPKDRERRRSIIQAVSDFFTSRSSTPKDGGSSPSSSIITSPSAELIESNSTATSSNNRDKFSLFKLTPKLLHKDRKSASKSRETLSPLTPGSTEYQSVSPGSSNSSNHSVKLPSSKQQPLGGFVSYLPDMVIQRLNSSPTPFKTTSSSNNSGRSNLPLQRYESESLQAYPESSRMKEVHDMNLQLEAIENEQRQLEIQGIAIERKLTGEEKVEENREQIEMMEEQWFTLVREKTRLARLAREINVSIKQLQLEEKLGQFQEKLNKSLHLSDIQKTPDQKVFEAELQAEIRCLENRKENLLTQFHDDVQKYESEDAELELKIASSNLNPRESNV